MAWNDSDNPSGSDQSKPKRKNPWGTPAGGDEKPQQRPNDSWPPQRSGGDNSDPHAEIQEMLKKAQNNFKQALPNGINPVQGVLLIALAVVLVWLASGFYFVQPNQNAVVLTFGKYTRTEENSGLKYRLPLPIQTHTIVDVTTERRIEIGFRDGVPSFRSNTNVGASNDIASESLMLTGDENIIDIDFVVMWRVVNAKDFLFEIRDPERTIKIAGESAMREIIGRTRIQPALTEARTQIQADARQLMQSILDDYKAGVAISNIQLQKVDPPQPVIDAFNEVQRARQQKEELRNKAEGYRNDIIPRARGESERLKQQAEAYKSEVVSRANGDATRFKSVLEAYKSGKTVTAERMYLETMEEIMNNAQTIVLDDKAGSGALPYLSLNELRGKKPAPATAE